MYKRRKVFSKIGEKTFSTTEFQTQKEFAAKKKDGESKKEKVAKAGAIGGSVVALGGMSGALKDHAKKGYHSLMEKYHDKAADRAFDKISKPGDDIAQGVKHALKRESHTLGKEKAKSDIIKNAKTAKKLGKVGLVGLGVSAGSGIAYKALKKKKDQKEFAEKKKDEKPQSTKKEKTLKAATIGGAAVAAGGAADSIISGRKKHITRAAKDFVKDVSGISVIDQERSKKDIDKLGAIEKKLGKRSKRAAIISGVGLGTSIAAGQAYKHSKKKD